MPNAFAYLMLLIWPVVCAVLMRRLPLERGLIWSLLAGYLLLPPIAAFDLPLVPALDKYSIPNVAVLTVLIFGMKQRVGLWPKTGAIRILIVLFVAGVVPTVLTNSEPLIFEQASLPGLSLRDLFSVVTNQLIILIPFLVGRQILASETGLRELLLAFVIGGLVYSLPALIEIRLSPQINTWVYGFFQHRFDQVIRQGGFRPMVFLPHGLWLAFFMMTTIVSAAALARWSPPTQRPKLMAACGYLLLVLFLSKSLAAWVFALALTPLVLLAPVRLQMQVAVTIGTIAVLYPVLRNAGWVPLDAILAQADAIDHDRAQSLAYRFNNETLLLERAQDKTWFGWGGWGRNLLRDPIFGEILTIPDGRWIIVFGTFGWVGYIAEMGLLALPLVLLLRKFRKGPAPTPYAAAIAVILAATMADMLLNASLIPLTWLCAGAILGYAEAPLQSTHKTRPNDTRLPALGRKRSAVIRRPIL